MSIRFDLTDLRLFLHVAETASITQGASRSNMALSSASERVRAMEETLGVALLDRKPRGVRLTPAGSALERHARIVMHNLEEMRGDLNNFAQGLRSRVRVLANTVATVEFLPPALASFLAAHPNIDVDLEQRHSREVIRAISQGGADIGIIAEAVDPAEELETCPFAEDRLVLVTPRHHPLGDRHNIAFRETLEHDFIGSMPGTALQETLDHHAMRAGHRLKLRVRLSNFQFDRPDGGEWYRGRGAAGAGGPTISAVYGARDRSPDGRLGTAPLYHLRSKFCLAVSPRQMAG